jgi:acyl-CoA thioesterase FadM
MTTPRMPRFGLRWYAMTHLATVGDTSRAGFVYYARLIEWQGVCRERFGFEHCPGYMNSLRTTHLMVTQSVSCEYFEEIEEGQHIAVRLAIPWIRLHFMKGDFEYYRVGNGQERLVARGEQIWANTLRGGTSERLVLSPAPWTAEVIDVCRWFGTDISRALR